MVPAHMVNNFLSLWCSHAIQNLYSFAATINLTLYENIHPHHLFSDLFFIDNPFIYKVKQNNARRLPCLVAFVLPPQFLWNRVF